MNALDPISSATMNQLPSALDASDPLSDFRQKFHFPVDEHGNDILYFCGNSLGLQPIDAWKEVEAIMASWKKRAVEGHFYGKNPWISYLDELKPKMSNIVGALPSEVAIMNTLTTNLHYMMVSFYRPTSSKFKILCDYSPFPSDRYALASQVKFHGFNPDEAIIELKPKSGTEIVDIEDILAIIEEHGNEIALIMIGGINYYTGQFYPLKEIVAAGQKYRCKVGFDLAHAAGNVPVNLHDSRVDFAVWCTYKYLNSGPGNLSGCFVHDRHKDDDTLPRFTGWWGYKREDRFMMYDDFVPEPGAEGWVVSNPPVIGLGAIKASLDIFEQAGFDNLIEKSRKLTSYLYACISALNNPRISIITPQYPEKRGCQLSIRVQDADKSLFNNLRARGVLGDWREPDVIRIAPTPLYNSFQDVYTFTDILSDCLKP